MTTIGGRPRSKALRSTKRVCGNGPSAASTSSTTPSAIDKHALDFPAEVGVAGRVHDVDQGLAVVHRGVLRQDGDAALALELVAVHGALGDPLVGPQHAALAEHRIDQRGLAVVDVRDDGDVAAERIGYWSGLS